MSTNIYELLKSTNSLPENKTLILNISYDSKKTQDLENEFVTIHLEPETPVDIFQTVKNSILQEFHSIHAGNNVELIHSHGAFTAIVLKHCLFYPMYTPIKLFVDRNYMIDKYA